MAKIGTLIIAGIVGYTAINAYTDRADKEAKLDKFAAEINLNQSETQAFKICQGQMKNKSLNLNEKMSIAVPKDICGCHATKMVKIFKDGKYKSHANVINFLVGEKDKKGNPVPRTKEPKPISEKELRAGQNATKAFITMAKSINQCADTFITADKRKKQKECSNAREGSSQSYLCKTYKDAGYIRG